MIRCIYSLPCLTIHVVFIVELDGKRKRNSYMEQSTPLLPRRVPHTRLVPGTTRRVDSTSPTANPCPKRDFIYTPESRTVQYSALTSHLRLFIALGDPLPRTRSISAFVLPCLCRPCHRLIHILCPAPLRLIGVCFNQKPYLVQATSCKARETLSDPFLFW